MILISACFSKGGNMRLISIADDKGRDAIVGIASCNEQIKPKFEVKKEEDSVIPIFQEDKPEIITSRYIKSTIKTEGKTIIRKNNNDMDMVANELIREDPDIDFMKEGMKSPEMHRIFITQNNEAAPDIHFEEQIFDPYGRITETHPFKKAECNIQNENCPIKWTGVTVDYKTAFTRYVFVHNYQLFHVNGLTYEFLYSMAKHLAEKKVLMLVGGGKDGSEPVVLRQGGKKYRAFMSGEVSGEEYGLYLHFTQFDLEDFAR